VAEAHRFSVTASWDRGKESGRVQNADRTFDAEHRGASPLGGPGGAANPEELLLAGVSACFTQTWALFVKKLGLPLQSLRLEAACMVEPDPAGGFRITEIELHPEVPSDIWAAEREKVEKTLQLAEKYCIVSKAVREGRTFKVTPRPV